MANRKSKPQLSFTGSGFKPERSDHGGDIRNPQKRKRPLGVSSSLHLVLRSTKAKGDWNFRRHKKTIEEILSRFSRIYFIERISTANVGNHLHLHIRVRRRDLYRKFIRAISSAIMIKVTGYSRWNKPPKNFRFWDRRPFSRIVKTWTEFLNLKKYVQVNQWEGHGINRKRARDLVRRGLLAPPDI